MTKKIGQVLLETSTHCRFAAGGRALRGTLLDTLSHSVDGVGEPLPLLDGI